MSRQARVGYDYFAATTNDSKIRLVGSETSPLGASHQVLKARRKCSPPQAASHRVMEIGTTPFPSPDSPVGKCRKCDVASPRTAAARGTAGPAGLLAAAGCSSAGPALSVRRKCAAHPDRMTCTRRPFAPWQLPMGGAPYLLQTAGFCRGAASSIRLAAGFCGQSAVTTL